MITLDKLNDSATERAGTISRNADAKTFWIARYSAGKK